MSLKLITNSLPKSINIARVLLARVAGIHLVVDQVPRTCSSNVVLVVQVRAVVSMFPCSVSCNTFSGLDFKSSVYTKRQSRLSKHCRHKAIDKL